MLSKRSPPLIGKLTGSSVSSAGGGGATSPRSPLELKIQSPRGLKSYNLDGVGLGIVAALEKSGNFRNDIQANRAFLSNKNSNRSKPIPVNSANNYPRSRKASEEMEMEMEMDDFEEEYTFVTYHRPENKSYTRVYCNGDEQTQTHIDTTVFNRSMKSKSKSKSKNTHGIVYEISPARFNDFSAYPSSDFLNSCDLCQKKLHGKDIYMYRGEKAFCSIECRYRQIVMDERKEKCGSEASRSSVDVSTSPYTTSDQIFSTGILAI